MKIYAFVYEGVVWEIIPPLSDENGVEVPISERYAPSFVEACVDITKMTPQPEQGWITRDGGETFLPSLS